MQAIEGKRIDRWIHVVSYTDCSIALIVQENALSQFLGKQNCPETDSPQEEERRGIAPSRRHERSSQHIGR